MIFTLIPLHFDTVRIPNLPAKIKLVQPPTTSSRHTRHRVGEQVCGNPMKMFFTCAKKRLAGRQIVQALPSAWLGKGKGKAQTDSMGSCDSVHPGQHPFKWLWVSPRKGHSEPLLRDNTCIFFLRKHQKASCCSSGLRQR